MIDEHGNLMENPDCDTRQKDDYKRTDDKSSDKDTVKEGGEDSAYEGGDNQDHKNGNQVNGSQDKMSKHIMSNGINQDGQSNDTGSMQRNYIQISSHSNLPPTAKPSKWQRNYDNLSTQDRQEMLVDEIFALYLYRMSIRIN